MIPIHTVPTSLSSCHTLDVPNSRSWEYFSQSVQNSRKESLLRLFRTVVVYRDIWHFDKQRNILAPLNWAPESPEELVDSFSLSKLEEKMRIDKFGDGGICFNDDGQMDGVRRL